MKSNWEKDIHDRLGNFGLDAPDGLWADISRKMSEANNGDIHAHKPARAYKLLQAASVAAAACAVLTLGYTFYANSHNDKTVQMPQPGSNLAKNYGPNLSLNFLSVTKDKKTAVMAGTLQNGHGKPCGTVICREGADLPQGRAAHADTVEAAGSVDAQESDAGRNESTPKRNSRGHNGYNNNPLLAYDAAAKRSAAGNGLARWSVSTSAMGAMGWGKSAKYIGKPVVAAGPDDTEWHDNPMLGINLFNQGKEVKTEYKHRLPVRIGVKVGYAFSERLSIESGLTYTRLSSDVKSGSDDNYFTGEQKLNYVGIPVGVRYDALMFKRFRLYGTVNALLEKCVSGNVTSNYVINKATNKTETHAVGSKPLQFSVGAGVGVQVDVLDNVGIYAEPGLSCHFNDRSSLQTIYKEKPLNFNLSIGIRYTINK